MFIRYAALSPSQSRGVKDGCNSVESPTLPDDGHLGACPLWSGILLAKVQRFTQRNAWETVSN